MAKAKSTNKRTVRKGQETAAPLRLMLPTEPQPIVVPDGHEVLFRPTVDENGTPLSPWQVARWYLGGVVNTMLEEHERHLEKDPKRAADCERAFGVAQQLYVSLDPGAPAVERERLVGMARLADSPAACRLRASRDQAESLVFNMLRGLHAPTATARASWGEDAARNMAHLALFVLGNQYHSPDAPKLRRRWPTTDGRFSNVAKFKDDVDELASRISELLLEPERAAVDFANEVGRRMYRILGLGRWRTTGKRRERRRKKARRA